MACAFPRAELTELSYAFEKENDELARELEQVNTNRDRSMIIAQAILENRIPNLTDSSHMAAVERLRSLLRDPYSKLNDIQMHVKDSFNRLYRLRNLVLHAGLTNAIGLSAALRTATPLVSAGIDRIAHFRYIGGIHPIELAARARIALATVSPSRPLGCLDLLGV